MNNEERGFLFFLLALVLTLTAVSSGFSSSSRMLPMIAGCFVSVALILLLIASYAPRLNVWYRRLESKATQKMKPLTAEERKRELSVTAWFIASVPLVYLVGFLFAIPLFLFLFLKLYAKESWLASLAIPGTVFAVVYIAFITVLRVPLYTGLFY
jgi:hypothetical protein